MDYYQRKRCETHDHLFDKIVEKCAHQAEAYQECFFAYLSNPELPHDERMKAVEEHLKEWAGDNYCSASRRDRNLSVNKVPEGKFSYHRDCTRRTRRCVKHCRAWAATEEFFDTLNKPGYYVNDKGVCWECELAKGIDDGWLTLMWIALLGNAYHGGYIKKWSEALTIFHDSMDNYNRTQDEIGEVLGVQQPAISKRLTKISNNFNNNLKKVSKIGISRVYKGRRKAKWIAEQIREYEQIHDWDFQSFPTLAEQIDSIYHRQPASLKQIKKLSLADKAGWPRPSQRGNFSIYQ